MLESDFGTNFRKWANDKLYDKYMQNHLTIVEQDYLEMLNKEIE